jgi:hypothetical protein
MLKALAILSGLALLLTLTTSSVSAHLAGQPPYFKINGKYANLYPVPLTSLENFQLPQDLAPESYLVNQNLNFELDINRLPAPPEVVRKTKFSWYFGDGNSASGLATSHSYSKTGSLFLTVYADDGTTPAPQILESVLLNILPSSSYQLPKVIIKINGRQSQDPLTDVLQFQLGQNLNFDGSSSTAPSSKIVSYTWDFGDKQSSDKAADSHFYPRDLTQVFPVLRVKDANGFFADNFAEIQNAENAMIKQGNPIDTKSNVTGAVGSKTQSQLPVVLGGLIVLVFVGFMVRSYSRGRGRGRRR